MPERLREIISAARSASVAGDHNEAARGYYDAAERARSFELPGELAYCLRHGAQSSLELDDVERALSAAQEAAGIYDEIEPHRGMNHANTARLIALAMEGLGRRDEAKTCWSQARAIYDLHGVNDGVMECDAHLGAAR